MAPAGTGDRWAIHGIGAVDRVCGDLLLADLALKPNLPGDREISEHINKACKGSLEDQGDKTWKCHKCGLVVDNRNVRKAHGGKRVKAKKYGTEAVH